MPFGVEGSRKYISSPEVVSSERHDIEIMSHLLTSTQVSENAT